MNFREELIRLYQTVHEQAQRATNERAQDYLRGTTDTLIKVIKAYDATQKGDTLMAKLQIDDIIKGTTRLDEIQPRTANGELVSVIIKLSEDLRPGRAIEIDTKVIKANTFANRVYALRKEKKIPDNITVVRRGDRMYLGLRN